MSIGEDDLLELTAGEAAAAMRSGALKATAYAEHLLATVESCRELRALIAIDGEAVLRTAREADAKRAEGRVLGALHGVPIVVKDNIDVAGLPATAGTPALRGNRPTRDADVVARLKHHGAIVLGKANMHELAAGVTTNNAAFGTARNPYQPAHVPGGSSGGTAAAVAARMCPIGLGTDTGASNRVPAAYCGVFGFRPSIKRWPQTGMIMNSPTRDTIGPMARCMADIVLADGIVTGEAPPSAIPLSGLRLGVPRYPLWDDLDGEVADVAEATLAMLQDAGVTLVEAPLPDLFELAERAGTSIAMAEHAPALDAYLEEAGSDLCAEDVFVQVASPDVRNFLGAFLGQVTPDQYREALAHRRTLQSLFQTYYDDHAIDAMIFPTSSILAPPITGGAEILHNGRAHSTLWLAVRNTNPGSIAGIPGLSLPAGMSSTGLPIGIEIDGRAEDDSRLLGIGFSLEPLLPRLPSPPL